MKDGTKRQRDPRGRKRIHEVENNYFSEVYTHGQDSSSQHPPQGDGLIFAGIFACSRAHHGRGFTVAPTLGHQRCMHAKKLQKN